MSMLRTAAILAAEAEAAVAISASVRRRLLRVADWMEVWCCFIRSRLGSKSESRDSRSAAFGVEDVGGRKTVVGREAMVGDKVVGSVGCG